MKILMKMLRTIYNKINSASLLFMLVNTLLLTSLPVNANAHLTQHLKMVGQGEMSWLFIDLYQASLYSPTGEYKQTHYPQALNILYQKNIDKDHLITATEKEWQKLGLNEALYGNWLAQLNNIWPDINKGDELLFLVEDNGSGYFYHNKKLLGSVNNQQFSEAFLSIWLSQNSSEPTLRKQLLGI